MLLASNPATRRCSRQVNGLPGDPVLVRAAPALDLFFFPEPDESLDAAGRFLAGHRGGSAGWTNSRVDSKSGLNRTEPDIY
jgi:hypothetical protein